jgi:cobalt/nickel transport system permease protein
MAIFAVTQIPLAIVEGAVTSLMFKYIFHSRSDVLVRLNVVSLKAVQKLREVSV